MRAETETRAAGRVALYEQLQTLPSAWRRILGQEFAIAVATAPDEAEDLDADFPEEAPRQRPHRPLGPPAPRGATGYSAR